MPCGALWTGTARRGRAIRALRLRGLLLRIRPVEVFPKSRLTRPCWGASRYKNHSVTKFTARPPLPRHSVKKQGISSRSVERLSLYRRALLGTHPGWGDSVYSHQLATACGLGAAQVRRDLMAIGYSGSPNAGYEVERLLRAIDAYLDAPEPIYVAVVGVGYLGRALVTYLSNRSPNLVVTAAFDNDPKKTDRVLSGVNCYPVGRLGEVMAHQKIDIGIITVPPSTRGAWPSSWSMPA